MQEITETEVQLNETFLMENSLKFTSGHDKKENIMTFLHLIFSIVFSKGVVNAQKNAHSEGRLLLAVILYTQSAKLKEL